MIPTEFIRQFCFGGYAIFDFVAVFLLIFGIKGIKIVKKSNLIKES
ncbi:hypothetical protein KKD03_05450 [Patescibacteria group bacterium]|nr:hypothetical protein [Patescibacteria group bacterium]